MLIDYKESKVKIWLRRIGYTAVFLTWCAVMILPTVLCVSLADGQMVWGNDPSNQVRVFVMQEVGQEGIGVQWSRPATADGACTDTSVRYFMFAGEADNNNTCSCMSTPSSGQVPNQCELIAP
jgi:hypothetical protein